MPPVSPNGIRCQMKWGSRGVAKVEEMACHLSSAFKGRTLLMKILTVESIMDPLCLTFDSELSPRDNVSFQKHCPEGNNGFHVLSVFKLSTFPSFYPTIAFLWFLNTPSYTELWPDTHCLTLSLDHRGLKIVAWPCPPPSTSPPPPHCPLYWTIPAWWGAALPCWSEVLWGLVSWL